MFPKAENLNNNGTTIQPSLDGFSYFVDSDKHTFVPADLYQENKKEKYLEFLGISEKDSIVRADFISEANVYNVYSIPKKGNRTVCHASSVLLANLIKENRERTDDVRVYLNIKDLRFEMFVLKGTNLLFNNTFRFKTKEDFLYFLLFSMEQLNLDPGSVVVYFIGMITEDSKIVELTKRYIRDIRFKKDMTCE